jgi:hypothetical protein
MESTSLEVMLVSKQEFSIRIPGCPLLTEPFPETLGFWLKNFEIFFDNSDIVSMASKTWPIAHLDSQSYSPKSAVWRLFLQFVAFLTQPAARFLTLHAGFPALCRREQ